MDVRILFLFILGIYQALDFRGLLSQDAKSHVSVLLLITGGLPTLAHIAVWLFGHGPKIAPVLDNILRMIFMDFYPAVENYMYLREKSPYCSELFKCGYFTTEDFVVCTKIRFESGFAEQDNNCGLVGSLFEPDAYKVGGKWGKVVRGEHLDLINMKVNFVNFPEGCHMMCDNIEGLGLPTSALLIRDALGRINEARGETLVMLKVIKELSIHIEVICEDHSEGDYLFKIRKHYVNSTQHVERLLRCTKESAEKFLAIMYHRDGEVIEEIKRSDMRGADVAHSLKVFELFNYCKCDPELVSFLKLRHPCFVEGKLESDMAGSLKVASLIKVLGDEMNATLTRYFKDRSMDITDNIIDWLYEALVIERVPRHTLLSDLGNWAKKRLQVDLICLLEMGGFKVKKPFLDKGIRPTKTCVRLLGCIKRDDLTEAAVTSQEDEVRDPEIIKQVEQSMGHIIKSGLENTTLLAPKGTSYFTQTYKAAVVLDSFEVECQEFYLALIDYKKKLNRELGRAMGGYAGVESAFYSDAAEQVFGRGRKLVVDLKINLNDVPFTGSGMTPQEIEDQCKGNNSQGRQAKWVDEIVVKQHSTGEKSVRQECATLCGGRVDLKKLVSHPLFNKNLIKPSDEKLITLKAVDYDQDAYRKVCRKLSYSEALKSEVRAKMREILPTIIKKPTKPREPPYISKAKALAAMSNNKFSKVVKEEGGKINMGGRLHFLYRPQLKVFENKDRLKEAVKRYAHKDWGAESERRRVADEVCDEFLSTKNKYGILSKMDPEMVITKHEITCAKVCLYQQSIKAACVGKNLAPNEVKKAVKKAIYGGSISAELRKHHRNKSKMEKSKTPESKNGKSKATSGKDDRDGFERWAKTLISIRAKEASTVAKEARLESDSMRLVSVLVKDIKDAYTVSLGRVMGDQSLKRKGYSADTEEDQVATTDASNKRPFLSR